MHKPLVLKTFLYIRIYEVRKMKGVENEVLSVATPEQVKVIDNLMAGDKMLLYDYVRFQVKKLKEVGE